MNTRYVAICLALVAFVVRFLAIGAIDNDHYVYLARAHQVLQGAWPVRDFADPGLPLGYLLSAAAAAIAGPTLLTEAVLATVLFAAGVAMTFVLARRASGDLVVGLVAAATVLLLPPRLYNATKVLVPAVAIAIAWWYADRPTTGRAVLLGGWIGIAFLFRHDYAAYLGFAAAVMLAVRHGHSPRALVSPAVWLVLAAVAVATPWLLYVHVEQGLAEYFASAARFSLAERNRTVTGWGPAFYGVAAVPLIAWLLARRGTRTLTSSQVAFACLLVFASDLVLLRDQPLARLPDVYAMTTVTGAILIGRLGTPPRMAMARRFAVVAVVAVAATVLLVEHPAAARGRELMTRWQRVAERLREARPEITPRPELAPLVRYLERCTAPRDRVLIGGFAPELPVLAHRPFAAGLPDWIRGYYEDEADVARARTQLRREPVGAAVMLDGGDTFASSWPSLADDLRARGFTPAFLQLPDERIELWLPPASRRDEKTGLPCPREE